MTSIPSRHLALLCFALLACDTHAGAAAPAVDNEETLALRAVQAEQARVNALVPEALRGKLEFVAQYGSSHGMSSENYEFVALLPKGWRWTSNGGLHPRDPRSDTDFSVQPLCQGSCDQKDWAKRVDEIENEARNLREGYTAVSVTRDANSRTAVWKNAERPTQLELVVQQWKPDAKRYFQCSATLDAEYQPALEAFKAACATMKPLAWRIGEAPF